MQHSAPLKVQTDHRAICTRDCPVVIRILHFPDEGNTRVSATRQRSLGRKATSHCVNNEFRNNQLRSEVSTTHSSLRQINSPGAPIASAPSVAGTGMLIDASGSASSGPFVPPAM